MKKFNQQREPQAEQKNIYQQITDEVIQALEKGVIVWKKPWAGDVMPRNIITGHMYRGWNPFYLNMVCILRNYELPYFLTFEQAKKNNAHVKKGEKGSKVIYWEAKPMKNKAIVTRDPQTGETKVSVPTIPILKQFTVFNVSQVEGLEYTKPEVYERTSIEKIEACEKTIAAMKNPPPIKFIGGAACYIPALDEVHMPQQNKFFTDEAYYSTLFHELVHATGHATRLKREEVMNPNQFGTQPYSKEELVAELGNTYLSGITGILPKTLDNSAAYIEGWLNRLRHNEKFFLQACSQAQAAADYITGETYATATAEQDMAAA